jgi:hypothetical protein
MQFMSWMNWTTKSDILNLESIEVHISFAICTTLTMGLQQRLSYI